MNKYVYVLSLKKSCQGTVVCHAMNEWSHEMIFAKYINIKGDAIVVFISILFSHQSDSSLKLLNYDNHNISTEGELGGTQFLHIEVNRLVGWLVDWLNSKFCQYRIKFFWFCRRNDRFSKKWKRPIPRVGWAWLQNTGRSNTLFQRVQSNTFKSLEAWSKIKCPNSTLF